MSRSLPTSSPTTKAMDVSRLGHVCGPGEQQIPKVCVMLAPLTSQQARCPFMPPWGVSHCYANPPWNLVGPWLARVKDNPQIWCLMVTPYWVSALWWPLLVKLHVPGCKALLIPPFYGMFPDCWGNKCPPQGGPSFAQYYPGRLTRKASSA